MRISRALERAQRRIGPAGGDIEPGAGAGSRASGPSPGIRALAGRLQPLLASRSPVKIFLTACGPGEGATTVAQRLADALTIDGARVLLCVGKEIRSVLAIDRAVEESRSGLVLNNSVASLHIVDISDLQGAEVDVSEVVAFKNWLAAQASRFDAIVVDMPPVLLRHSWLSIVDMPDGIILVVEAEHTRSMVLKTTAKLLQQAGGHILGIVFNKRRHRIPRGLYRWL